jgi:hypothetical protein
MRRFPILMVSLGLNVVLAALALFILQRPKVAAVNDNAALPAPATNDAKPRVVAIKQYFSWREVESPDYQGYIAHLREIQCPEQTIRDIILADVNQLYVRKREAAVVTPDQQWWRSDPDTNVVQAAAAKILAFEHERRDLLKTLLGPDWETGLPGHTGIALNGPVLGSLADATKQSVRDIVAKSEQQARDSRADPAALARLEQQTRQELARVLNPAQLEEYLLRYSSSAKKLRAKLRGLDVSPDEFRNLFRAADPLYTQLALSDGKDPGGNAERDALAKQLDQTIKNYLGKDRYQAYLQLQDAAYAQALTNAQLSGAPPELLPALYELAKALKQERDRIQNDSSLTPEQKAAQLKAAEDQAKAAEDQMLGKADNVSPPEIMPPDLPPAQVHAYSPGETIDQIAAQYGISPRELLAANPNLNPNFLLRGTPIRIPQH